MRLIHNPVIAYSHPPGVGHAGQLFASSSKWVVAECLDFRCYSPLNVAWQLFQLAKRGWFELKPVGHNYRLSYSRSFFFTVSQGIVPGSFNASRAAAMSISSSSFSRSSTSSIGTTAATGFLPRCTITLSPRYAALLRMSEKFCRAVLAVNFGDIKGTLQLTRLYKTYSIIFCTFCNPGSST
jgi:hypothetical protein